MSGMPVFGWAVLGACVAITIGCVVMAWRVRGRYLSFSREPGLAYGHAVTASGRSFLISGLAFRDGALVLEFDVTGPFEGARQALTVISNDGSPVFQIPDVDLPSHGRSDSPLHITASVRGSAEK